MSLKRRADTGSARQRRRVDYEIVNVLEMGRKGVKFVNIVISLEGVNFGNAIASIVNENAGKFILQGKRRSAAVSEH